MIVQVISIFISLISLSLLFPKDSHAIIMLAPIILIPLIKLLAIVLAGLAIPSATIAVIWSKLFKTNLAVTITSALVILIAIVAVIGLIIKLAYPDLISH